MDKEQVAAVLEEIGLLLQLKGENPFKTRAYENAARILGMLDDDLEQLVREKRLGSIQGIGQALEKIIEELVLTGRLEYYEKLKAEFPDTLFDLLRIPGLGAKKVSALYSRLGICSIEELRKACSEDRLIDLPGFGRKTQENILKGIGLVEENAGRHLIHEAGGAAVSLLSRLKGCPGIREISVAGSLRRRKEIIKDIDILISTDQSDEVMDYIVSLPQVGDVTGRGDTKISFRLKEGIAVDIRTVSPVQYPYALHHFTGSKEHNTKMRHIAKSKGIKMNEYGLFLGEDEELIPCGDEAEIFNALGMAYIPPELREDRGEIEAAREGCLPLLVTAEDMRGILHVHTNYSDGHSTIRQMAEAARAMGYGYIGISDHSHSAFYANGLNIDDVLSQQAEIRELNDSLGDFRIFGGIESDILQDGSLDYSDEILSSFDFVIASVHSQFKMSKADMTKRILRAMDNPYTKILGHPTGRRLLSREGYEVDMEAILKKAAERGIIIEINANPQRLDLDWRWSIRAKELGVLMAVCADAHDISELSFMGFGVSVARKGWLETKDVVNCLDSSSLAALFMNN